MINLLSQKNVLRGIHYDKNTTKLVTSISGEIDQIVVDMRTNSKTYKKHLRFDMNNKKILCDNTTHGWKCFFS